MVTLVLDGVGAMLGGREIVRGVSTRLAGGELIGLLGPNGAGKSTLIRRLLGLVGGDGHVTLDGDDVGAMPRARLARRLAYLPQGQAVHWPLSVERLVALGRIPHLGPLSRMTPYDHDAVADALREAEITHLANRTATELSGGERARVLLARALAVAAPVLFADEPLASLDPDHQLHGMDILRRQADAGRLVVAVLHDLPLASRYCDRLLVLDDGRLVADGPPAEVLTAALLDRVYRVEVDGSFSPVRRLR